MKAREAFMEATLYVGCADFIKKPVVCILSDPSLCSVWRAQFISDLTQSRECLFPSVPPSSFTGLITSLRLLERYELGVQRLDSVENQLWLYVDMIPIAKDRSTLVGSFLKCAYAAYKYNT